VLAHCPQWWASQVSAGPSQKGIFLQLVEGSWGGHHHLQQQCNPVNFKQEKQNDMFTAFFGVEFAAQSCKLHEKLMFTASCWVKCFSLQCY
jgi:hypothetical protein